MDLDSDGDTCPDALEAGVSTNAGAFNAMSASGGAIYSGGIATGTANAYVGGGAATPGQYGANGFFNGIETSSESGVYNGAYTYQYALAGNQNVCIDSDGDGVHDLVDIDDDNDGVLDTVEMMITCTTKKPDNATSTATFGSGRGLALTYDGDLSTFGGSSAGAAPKSISDATYLFNTPLYQVNQVLFYPNGGTTYSDGQVTHIDSVKFYDSNNNLLFYRANVTIDQATTGTSYTAIDVSAELNRNISKIVFINLADSVHAGSSEAIWREVEVNYCAKEADTDNDGIPNRLDLDSDGDGCPDLKEAGVNPMTDVITPSSTINNAGTSYGIAAGSLASSQLNPSAADTNIDGLNDSVDPDLNGQTNYPSSYFLYALASGWNYCNDKDGDGIQDVDDIDDDNDGILDAVESPSCFYTAAEIAIPATVTTSVATTGAIANTNDNNTSTTFGFTNATTKTGLTVFEITPALSLQAAALQIEMNTSGQTAFSNTAGSLTIEGWNGTSWVTLMPAFNPSASPNTVSGTFQTFTFTQNQTAIYSKFRLQGLAGTVTSNLIREIKLVPGAAYNASAHPKTNCTVDTDNDGIPNHQDLDSDDDGCSDASETGVTGVLLPGYIIDNSGPVYSQGATAQGPYGINGFANPLETSTSPESGVYSGSYANYNNAINSTIHTCPVMPLVKPDVNVTYVNLAVSGNLSTNDFMPPGSTYGTAVAVPGYTNPGPAMPTITGSTGAYTFTSSVAGVYKFNVPACPPSVTTNCPIDILTIEVLEPVSETNKPFTAPDFAVTKTNIPVVLKTLANDNSGNNFTSLVPSSVSVTVAPKRGTATVNSSTGDITYTPSTDFAGVDTLTYTVCDDASPSPHCSDNFQIITVLTASATNSIIASDDYLWVPSGASGSGNVLANDMDPDGNTMTVTPQNMTIAEGNFVLTSNGSYTFTSATGYSGPVNFPYQVCDNGSPQACTQATLYIIVPSTSALPLDLLTFTAVKENNSTVGLNWTTTNEINSSHFVIERMVNGQWQPIGTVNATGNGNTGINSYYFQDRQPANGANYYRLKQVDFDDSYKYSPVRLVSFGANIKLSVYPNPADDYVIIQGSDLVPGSIHIYDALGQELTGMIKTEQVSPQQLKLQLYRLTSGMYIIKVNGQAVKIIKK